MLFSLSFNGIKKEYLICEKGKRRSAFAPVRRNLLSVPGMPGAHLESTVTEVRVIEQPITINAKDRMDERKLEEDLAAWLLTDQPSPLIFDEEPGRVYYAAVDGTLNIEDIARFGKGTITFICPDPYKYSKEDKSVIWPELKIIKQDYAGKVAGSTLENPHISKVAYDSSLYNPTSGLEAGSSGYNLFSSLNGSTYNPATGSNGGMAQHKFSFDLIAAIERAYGAIPVATTADKVAWLKNNIKKLTANWHGKGNNKLSNPLTKADFAGKVAGSITENPHLAKWGVGSTATPLLSPANVPNELNATWYGQLQTLNGSNFVHGTTGGGNVAQVLYSFNLIEHIKRKYGKEVPGATTADKVAWLRANVQRIIGNWYGKGSGPSGNKANFTFYEEDFSKWYGTSKTHSNSSVSLIQWIISAPGISGRIDSSGFVHFLAYAEASDGVTQSRIETDFIELEVELVAGGDKASFAQWWIQGGSWSNVTYHNQSTISKLEAIRPNPGIDRIDTNGFVHFLAYAEPSNGIALSVIETDYISLDIETNVPYLPIVVDNKGNADAKPIFTATVKAPITHLDIVTEEGYMRIGEPVNIEETPVEREQLILKETLKTTTGWATATEVDGGTVAGTMISDGETFRVQSYGTGSYWHGPALKKSLSEQLQDFKVDVFLSLKTEEVRQAGRIELYFRDVNDITIGKLSLKEMLTASDSVHGEARIGALDGGKFLINTEGIRAGVWNQFYGILRLTRIGDRIQAYIAKIDTSTGKHHTRWLSDEFIDSEGLFQAKLAQIQIHIGQHGSKAAVGDIGMHEVQVYKIIQINDYQIPYIAYPGDIIEIDMVEKDIRINGESRMDLKDFGSSFFALQPGENIITYSHYDVVDLKVDWREPFK